MTSQRLPQNTCVLSLFLITATVICQASGFGPVAVFSAHQGPVFATAADLNEDGIADLLVVNSLSNDLSVLIGNADGSYAPPVNYPVGLSPISLAISYFNNDTHFDVAVANSGSNNVSVLIGNGDGTFGSVVNYPVGTGTTPRAIIWAGFTTSGNVDLVVANSTGGSSGDGNIAVLYGNGDGTFQTAVNFDTLGSQPIALVSAVFGTSEPALAVLNAASNSVTVFVSDGMRGFTTTGDFPVGGVGPSSMSPWLNRAQVNLVVSNAGSNDMTVLFGTGSGTFNHSSRYAVGAAPSSVTQGVFNLTNYLLNVAVANQGDSTVSIFGTRQNKPYFRKPVTFASCQSPKSVSVAFINNDPYEDLVLACSNGVGVMLNTGP